MWASHESMQRRLLTFIAVGDQNRMPTVSHRRSLEFVLEGGGTLEARRAEIRGRRWSRCLICLNLGHSITANISAALPRTPLGGAELKASSWWESACLLPPLHQVWGALLAPPARSGAEPRKNLHFGGIKSSETHLEAANALSISDSWGAPQHPLATPMLLVTESFNVPLRLGYSV